MEIANDHVSVCPDASGWLISYVCDGMYMIKLLGKCTNI